MLNGDLLSHIKDVALIFIELNRLRKFISERFYRRESADQKKDELAEDLEKMEAMIQRTEVYAASGMVRLYIEIERMKHLGLELADTQDQMLHKINPPLGGLRPGRAVDRAYGSFKEGLRSALCEHGKDLPQYLRKIVENALEIAEKGHKEND